MNVAGGYVGRIYLLARNDEHMPVLAGSGQPGKTAAFAGRSPGENAGSLSESMDTAGAGRALRILYAEDDAVNRLVVASYFTRRGAVVQCVEDGAQALRAVENAVFDLVLMDINMPVMDGISAMREIRSRSNLAMRSDVPIIAVTAYSSEEDRQKFLEQGFTAFFAKPVNLEALRQAIVACLARTVD